MTFFLPSLLPSPLLSFSIAWTHYIAQAGLNLMLIFMPQLNAGVLELLLILPHLCSGNHWSLRAPPPSLYLFLSFCHSLNAVWIEKTAFGLDFLSYFCIVTMTKAIYKRKYLIGSFLAISEGESMTITAGNMMVGRQACYWSGKWESLRLIYRQGGRESEWGWAWNGLLEPNANKATLPNPS